MSILHFNCRRALNWLRFPLPLDSISPWEARTAPSPTNAQRFPENYHLGDDLNGIGGENSDLGDPIYAVADGRVLLARNGGAGWGNVIIVLHAIEEKGARRYVQSYYSHCDEILVEAGDDVRRGQQIATVGTGNGQYFAHLHFEMREFITPFIGPGYREKNDGWLNPSAFIAKRRGRPEGAVERHEKVCMKKCHGRSCCTAGQAGAAG